MINHLKNIKLLKLRLNSEEKGVFIKFNGDQLAKLRKEQHYTLKQVAEFAGVTIPYISSLE